MTENSLDLIDLDIPALGYTKFVSSWLYAGPEGNFLIDPGPACSIPVLIRALDEKRVKNLDWVLLTHIHQDHAGGLGDLIKKFPEAKVVCHEKGVKHLLDPVKLWKGSKTVLGHVARVYDRILPVPEENVSVLDTVPFGAGIRVIPTPGHASHHQCYVFKDWFFAGELFGAYVPQESGLYLRPATPYRFILDDYLASMNKVEEHLRETICFAHYNSATDPELILGTARNQLKLWVKIIDENKECHDMEKIIDALLQNDDIFAQYNSFSSDLQEREREFSINSINGILKYLETKE